MAPSRIRCLLSAARAGWHSPTPPRERRRAPSSSALLVCTPLRPRALSLQHGGHVHSAGRLWRHRRRRAHLPLCHERRRSARRAALDPRRRVKKRPAASACERSGRGVSVSLRPDVPCMSQSRGPGGLAIGLSSRPCTSPRRERSSRR
eukprot:7005833-Prymnesium_polylepis.1